MYANVIDFVEKERLPPSVPTLGKSLSQVKSADGIGSLIRSPSTLGNLTPYANMPPKPSSAPHGNKPVMKLDLGSANLSSSAFVSKKPKPLGT